MKTFKPVSSYEKKKIGSASGYTSTGGTNGPNNSKMNKSAAQNGKGNKWSNTITPNKPRVLSISQLLARLRLQRQKRQEKQKTGGLTGSVKPIIPPKSLLIRLNDKPAKGEEKTVYNRRIIDYKHCGLLQRYIGLGGKILPRRQTRLTAKQQRYVARTIKSARVMALLPFVSKEKSLYR